MTLRTLIRRSLRFHWRAHLGVVLGAAVGSAALIGALVVGDSVRHTLKYQAARRLAGTIVALDSGDRFFGGDLLKRMIKIGEEQRQRAASKDGPIIWGTGFTVVESKIGLRLEANAARVDGTARAQRVNLYGFAPADLEHIRSDVIPMPGMQVAPFPSEGVWLNAALAHQLGVRVGDQLIFRIPKPSALPRDAAISQRNDHTVVMRLRVIGVSPSPSRLPNAYWRQWWIDAPNSGVGFPPTDLDLHATSRPALNAFVDFGDLYQALPDLEGKANLILASPASQMRKPNIMDRFRHVRIEAHNRSSLKPILKLDWVMPSSQTWGFYTDPRETFKSIVPVFHAAFKLNDAQLTLTRTSDRRTVELRTSRIFLDPPMARAALAADTNAEPILTYLVNLLRSGTNTTPYSMVTAVGPPWTPAGLRAGEIVVTKWLADDLQVKPGDEIALTYFDPESGARLVERTNTFRVHSVVPQERPWLDRSLMPDYPGLEKAESTSDWDGGFPLVHKIRPKDEEYWKYFRGTPKAFITLAAGQKMWGNRFGNLTAIRFPIPTNAPLSLTPTLSPGERENHSPITGGTKTGDSSTAAEKSSVGQQLSPLPGGEGQGEGERKTQTSEPPQVVAYKEALEKKILANLKPEELGLRFEPVREQALKAAEESQDFGGLFLGFSFFVIAAALLLMVLLFSLGLEQRAPEIGTLLALGFTPKQVRKLLLREGLMLSLLGGILGTFGGLAYAKAMLHGLTTIWRDAVGASALNFHFTGQTLVIGLFASVIVSTVSIWLTLRKFVRRPARELLVGEIGVNEFKVQGLKSKVIGAGAFAVALGLVAWSVARGDTSNAGIFFGAGALVLIAGLALVNARLVRLSGLDVSTLTPALSLRERENHTPASSTLKTGDEPRIPESSASGRVPSPLPAGERQGEGERAGKFSLAALGFRGCARRRKRSLSTVAMLACGSFLIVSIGVFRLDANRDAWKRTSGTGGFALIGETTMPVVHDLNTQAGRDFFALNEKDLAGVQFVPFRVREGDEASCLNLNRAQKPRLLGVKPELMKGRFAFKQTEKTLQKDHPWWLLKAVDSTISPPVLPNEVPAIGDANSIQWAMHKKVGDTIDYVDERGQPFKVRIVGAVANSILQGQLIIDEARFVQRFPGESGYRMFLIDAPSNAVSQVSATLSRALQDVGLELTPAAERLAQFNAVQNTYLGTFQVLGGLGLLLGSVGLGIVVLRNVLERRGELAVMLAVGFRKATLQRLLLIENGALLVAGLALGVAAAAVAVLPALFSPGAQLPLGSLALTLGAVLVNGALWTWAATRLAVRGDLMKALRNE